VIARFRLNFNPRKGCRIDGVLRPAMKSPRLGRISEWRD
jgi:hypothetical protein